MRLIDADALCANLDGMMAVSPTGYIHGDTIADMIGDAPTIELETIRCRDCKHKPHPTDYYDRSEPDCGFEIIFPDYKCPCRCADEYYNLVPDDNWFCGNAERREDATD